MSLMRFYVNGSLSLSFLVFWWCSFLDGFDKAFNVVFFPPCPQKSCTQKISTLKTRESAHLFLE